MNIIWICTNPPIKISSFIGRENVFGGWIDGMLNSISKIEGNNVTLLFVDSENVNCCIDNIRFVSFSDSDEAISLIENYDADIITIFGTENPLLNSIAMKNTYRPVTIWLQGLMCEIVKCKDSHINDFYKYKGFIEKIGCNIVNEYNFYGFFKRSKSELKVIKNNNLFFLGRTEWDKESFLNINPLGKYYNCMSFLRDQFYIHKGEWNINNCKKHRIFMSQASYSIKGLHIAIEVINLLKSKYQDVQLICAGENIFENNSLPSRFGWSYSNIIKNMIDKYELNDNVTFIGFKNQNEMINELKESNLFLLTSLIENESASLAEAMMIGVPVVSSDVGGIRTTITHGINGFLYQKYDYIKCAELISNIFEEKYDVNTLSINEVNRVEKLYDKEKNISKLMSIYDDIIRRKQ